MDAEQGRSAGCFWGKGHHAAPAISHDVPMYLRLLPSKCVLLFATAQVFGHIPAAHSAAQALEQSSAIGLLLGYLIGLIWAQEPHSSKIALLVKSRRQRSLSVSSSAARNDKAKTSHLLYLKILSASNFLSEIFDFLPNSILNRKWAQEVHFLGADPRGH